MRLRIHLDNPRPCRLPVNYQDLLAAAVYDLLARSDPDFARFLHDEGYAFGAAAGGGNATAKRTKLFVFSDLRVSRSRRRVDARFLHIAPGPLTWHLSSPRSDFLTHGATGLLALAAGEAALRVGPVCFPIAQVETLPPPAFRSETAFTCLTAIVATVPRPEGGTHYLRPTEADKFSEAVRRNLLKKHELLHGTPPQDERLRLDFDAAYLARDTRHDGTKKITYKNTDHIGALAPFTLAGSSELMQVGWECGLGEKNSAGFGMVEVCK